MAIHFRIKDLLGVTTWQRDLVIAASPRQLSWPAAGRSDVVGYEQWSTAIDCDSTRVAQLLPSRFPQELPRTARALPASIPPLLRRRNGCSGKRIKRQ